MKTDTQVCHTKDCNEKALMSIKSLTTETETLMCYEHFRDYIAFMYKKALTDEDRKLYE
jgi:hypothetical protein